MQTSIEHPRELVELRTFPIGGVPALTGVIIAESGKISRIPAGTGAGGNRSNSLSGGLLEMADGKRSGQLKAAERSELQHILPGFRSGRTLVVSATTAETCMEDMECSDREEMWMQLPRKGGVVGRWAL